MGLDIESGPAPPAIAPFGHVVVVGGNAWGETQSKWAESVSISVRCTGRSWRGSGRKRQRTGDRGGTPALAGQTQGTVNRARFGLDYDDSGSLHPSQPEYRGTDR